jgi:hypothetical protein
MASARFSLSLLGFVGVTAIGVAAATIWLMVTQPVTTAETVNAAAQGNLSPLARALAGVLYNALQGLLKYL